MAMIGAALIGAAATAYAASQRAKGMGGTTQTQTTPPVYRPETESLVGGLASTLGGKLSAYDQWYPFFMANAMGGAKNFLSGGYPSFGTPTIPGSQQGFASFMGGGQTTAPGGPSGAWTVPGQTAGPFGSQWTQPWTGGDQTAWVPTGKMLDKAMQMPNTLFGGKGAIDYNTIIGKPGVTGAPPEGQGYYAEYPMRPGYNPVGAAGEGEGGMQPVADWTDYSNPFYKLAPLMLSNPDWMYQIPEYKQVSAPGAASLPTPMGGMISGMPTGGYGIPSGEAPFSPSTQALNMAPNAQGVYEFGAGITDPNRLLGTGGFPNDYTQGMTGFRFPNQGSSPLFNMGQLQLADILSGSYDPTQNPQGFQTAYQTAASPLLRSFKEEILPSIGGEAMKMGGYSGSGAILARQMAADRLNTQLSELAGNLFGKERELGATMMSRGLGDFLPKMEQMPAQTYLGQKAAESAYYQPWMSQFAAQSAQYSPFTAQLQAMYAPVTAQMGLGQQAMGMMDPTITQLLQLLQGTASGGGTMGTYGYNQQSPDYISAVLGGAGGGLNAYKGFIDLQRSMGGGQSSYYNSAYENPNYDYDMSQTDMYL